MDFHPSWSTRSSSCVQNIYTDPQKPIQVQPEFMRSITRAWKTLSLVTTNFSITYFSVANEVEGSRPPAWLLVTDAEGMSVGQPGLPESSTQSASPRQSKARVCPRK